MSSKKKIKAKERTLDDLCRQEDCEGHLHFDLKIEHYICDKCDKKYDNGFLFEHVPHWFWIGKDNGSSMGKIPSSMSNENKAKFRKLRAIERQFTRGSVWKQYLKKIRYMKDRNGEQISDIWKEEAKEFSELQKCELIVELEERLNLPESVITDILYERKLWTSASRTLNSYNIFKEKGEHIKNSWHSLTKDKSINGSSVKLANVIHIIANTKNINENPYDISKVLKYLKLTKNGNYALNEVERFKEMQFLDKLIDNYDLSTDWKICKCSEELFEISGKKFKPVLITKYIYEKFGKLDAYTSLKYNQYTTGRNVLEVLVKNNVKTSKELSKIIRNNERTISYAIKMLEEEEIIQTHKEGNINKGGQIRYAFILNKEIFNKIPNFIIIKNTIKNKTIITRDVYESLNICESSGLERINHLVREGYLECINPNQQGRISRKYIPTKKAIDFYESVCKK